MAAAETETVTETQAEVTDIQVEGMEPEDLQKLYDQKVGDPAEESTEPTDEQKATETTETTTETEPATEEAATEEAKPEVTIESLRKEMDGMQKLLSRSQTELGGYRQLQAQVQQVLQNQQTQQTPDEEPADLYTDPDRYIDQRFDQRVNQQNQVQLQQQQSFDVNRQIAHDHFPEFDSLVDDIGGRMKELLGDEPNAVNVVSDFKSNPYQMDKWALVFAADSASLRRQITELKGKIKTTKEVPDKLIQNINNLGSQKPTISGGAGQASNNGDTKMSLTNEQIEQMGQQDPSKLQELYDNLINK